LRAAALRHRHRGIEGGAFDREWQLMAESGFRFDYQDRPTNGPDKALPKLKLKYTCPACGSNVWGKPDTAVGCKPCGYLDMLSEQAAGQSYDRAA
jgi:hypothetical protein